MAKVFIGIALVVMLATAAVGFLTKGKIDALQTTLTTTKGKIASAEGAARAAKNDAEKAQKELKDASEKQAAAEQLAAAKTKEAADSKNDADAAKLVLDKKEMEIKDLTDKLAKAGAGTPDPTVMAAKDAQIADLTTKLDNTTKERDEAKMNFETEVAKGRSNEENVANLLKEKRLREQNITKRGLQGHILAVNYGWNFVVLSVGDKQGVTMNAPLLVVRGNEPIARLRITSVEPSTSIADVLPGTLRKGSSVQPGDTVIFEGSRTQSDQPAAKTDTTPTVPPINTPANSNTPALPNN